MDVELDMTLGDLDQPVEVMHVEEDAAVDRHAVGEGVRVGGQGEEGALTGPQGGQVGESVQVVEGGPVEQDEGGCGREADIDIVTVALVRSSLGLCG